MPEMISSEVIEQKAKELHEADAAKAGHVFMAGNQGVYSVAWPSWDSFSEEVRENYRNEAREILKRRSKA